MIKKYSNHEILLGASCENMFVHTKPTGKIEFCRTMHIVKIIREKENLLCQTKRKISKAANKTL